MEPSFSAILIFALPLLLAACGVLCEARRRHGGASRRSPPTCANAVEGAGLKLEPDTYCDYAFEILRALEAYALPVIAGKRFLGFFTLTDELKCGGRDRSSIYVGAVMRPASECRYVRADSNLEYARRELRRSLYSMLPVLDRNERLVGFVTEESIDRIAGRTPVGV
ncbi:MAG TPA: CBS domain-containing protein [Candidatus Baltobacteraceae bacterium]|nr:CBS domain-containing protein [Candidatus Baltobacteraceae bacterium]